MTSFVVDRSDIRRSYWIVAADKPLKLGQVRVAVQSVAVTANNISYARFGERLKYWDFYPATPGFGHVPAWGFAEVIETTAEGFAVGDRLYGLFTLAQRLILTVGTPSPTGFVESSPHRQHLAPVYNQYRRVAGNRLIEASGEALCAIFNPLFLTAFLIKDMIDDEGMAPDLVIVSSASSKTSLGLAHALGGGRPGAPQVIGLTSPANLEFASGSGYFDEVVRYEDIERLTKMRAVFVDMAGNAAIRTAVHRHFGDHLVHSAAVGGTHWEALGPANVPAGPRPQLFFAPGRVAKRQADWGVDALDAAYAESWAGFIRSLQTWLRIETVGGREAIGGVYDDVLEGRTDHRTCQIVDLQSV